MSTTIVMPVPLGTPTHPRKYDPFEKQKKLIIFINLSEERAMWQLKILYKTKFILDLYRTYKPCKEEVIFKIFGKDKNGRKNL